VLSFFVSHSLGELDVILPILVKLRSENPINKFHIIFLVEKIYRDFLENDFYKTSFNILSAEVCFYLMPNKFDINDRENKLPIKIKHQIIKPLSLLRILKIVYSSNYIFHEHSCQISSIKKVQTYAKFLQRKIYIYVHAHACNIDTRIKQINFCPKNGCLLNFHEHSTKTYESAGYDCQVIIGYPKFYKQWKLFLLNNFSTFQKQKYILIFSRSINKYYMPEKLYGELFYESITTVKKIFGPNKLIVIKPHPREDIKFLKRTLNKFQGNFQISLDESSLLSLNADATISFWTSAILSSVALGIPSVEFYKESALFQEIEPKGSAYKRIGLNSVKNKHELHKFLLSVYHGEYCEPIDAIRKLNDNDDINLSNILLN